MTPKRVTLELVNHDQFMTDDNWETIWKKVSSAWKRVTSKAECDRIRFIAIVAFGGGRNDYEGM